MAVTDDRLNRIQHDCSHANDGHRINIFDTIRGFTIVSMVLFHGCYDLAYIIGIPMPWFTGTLFQSIWRCSISWVFLLLAGWMTRFSHSNFHRAVKYGVAALLVFIATYIGGVDTVISWGIIFCMAASTLLFAVIQKPLLEKVPPVLGVAICLALFALTYHIPLERYDVPYIAWLGFPSPTFSSGDYYPLLPYFFMYCAGYYVARFFERSNEAAGRGMYPRWAQIDVCPVLTSIGRHSLIIYLLHQPVLLVLIELISLLMEAR